MSIPRFATLAALLPVLGCATAPLNDARLHRALTPARYDLTGVDTGATEHVHLEGVVAVHRSIVGDGQVRELVLAPGSPGGPSPTLRYALPLDQRIPVEVGSSVTIDLYVLRGQADRRDDQALAVRSEGHVVALLDAGGALPPDDIPEGLSVSPGPETAYRESGRRAGFCDAVVDHRTAIVKVSRENGPPERRVVLPGQSTDVRTPDGSLRFTLIDNARTEATTCPDLALDRFSYLILQPERPRSTPALGGGDVP